MTDEHEAKETEEQVRSVAEPLVAGVANVVHLTRRSLVVDRRLWRVAAALVVAGVVLVALHQRLAAIEALLAPGTFFEAPDDCFFVGPKDVEPGASYAAQLFCPGGKPTLTLKPMIVQGTPRPPSVLPPSAPPAAPPGRKP